MTHLMQKILFVQCLNVNVTESEDIYLVFLNINHACKIFSIFKLIFLMSCIGIYRATLLKIYLMVKHYFVKFV